MVRITWNKKALLSLESVYNFIAEDSIQNAQMVKNDIFEIVYSLLQNPDKYNLDKYKTQNDGNFRAFEKHKIRVTYYVSEKEIRIVRVRHTKMNPKNY